MRKGFTLIELLIVIVLVAILVTIALPKYRASLERGHAVEGISNLTSASDWINSQYVLNGNTYPTSLQIDQSRSMYFSAPEFVGSKDYCLEDRTCIKTNRKQGDTVYYTLTAHNKDGELEKITCEGDDASLCANLGMKQNGTRYEMEF